MEPTHDANDFAERMKRLEGLIQEAEGFPDPAVQARTREIVRALLDLHGAGLEKILDRVAETGDSGLATIDDLARDDLVGSLLLLHGLHPLDIETRVLGALEKVRPFLARHGGDVEFLGIEEGVLRLRLQGNCHGCPSSAATLRSTIEQAVYDAAPDVTAIEVEEPTAPAPAGLVQLGIRSRSEPVAQTAGECSTPI